MASPHRRSLSVALEGSFGQIDANTGIPTVAGLSFRSVEGDRSDITTVGEPVITTVDELRASFYERPDEHITMKDGSGNLVQRRKGQVQLTCRVRGLGADPSAPIETWGDHPITWFLRSSMRFLTDADLEPIEVDTASSANIFVSDDTPAIPVGSVLAYDKLGRRSYVAVTDHDDGTDTYTVSPALPQTPVAEDVLLPTYTYGVRLGRQNSPASPLPSLAFRLDGDGWRTQAFGCRLASLEIAWEPDQEALWTFTFEAAHIQDDHSAGLVTGGTNIADPVRASGSVMHPLGAHHVISSTRSDVDAPAALARTRLPVESGSVTINFELAPCGDSLTILGMKDMEVTDITAEVELTLCDVQSLVARDYLDRVPRSLMLAFGPTGMGEGSFVYIPSAVMTTDPNIRDLGGDTIKQVLSYKVGLYGGDEGGDPELGANSLLRIGFVKEEPAS